MRESDVIFIAVGTPPLPSGEANLAYLESAARGIGAAMDGSRFRVVVNKSTVPVGSGNLVETLVREGVLESHPDISDAVSFGVASNPEFLREGSAIHDSLYPDRIVVGAEDPATVEIMRELYRPLMDQNFADPSFAPRPGSVQPGADADSDGRDNHHQRRDDQVLGQRVPRPEDRLRQRNVQYLRARRRGRDGSDDRHRPRQPHRPGIPECGHRLGRQLLRQGHQFAAAYGGGIRLSGAHSGSLARGEQDAARIW